LKRRYPHLRDRRSLAGRLCLLKFPQGYVLAGLLLFRLLYYIIPFALALVILGAREVLLNLHFRRNRWLYLSRTLADGHHEHPAGNMRRDAESKSDARLAAGTACAHAGLGGARTRERGAIAANCRRGRAR
jgi:hypothetical protein